MATTKPTTKSKLKPVEDLDVWDYGSVAMRRYGEEVNESRAIVALQDGLKPVARRLLWAGRAMNSQGKSARLVGQCFAAGTPVRLAHGADIPIENLVIGDEVLTDVGPRSVTATYFLPEKDLYEVRTSRGIVKATSDQVFYCLDARGREVERTPLTLKPGDRVKCLRS